MSRTISRTRPVVNVEALLRVLRHRTGATAQAEIAIESGLSPGVLNKWILGGLRPTLKQLGRAADRFGISIDAFIAEIRAEEMNERAPLTTATPPAAFPQRSDLVEEIGKLRARVEKLERARSPGIRERASKGSKRQPRRGAAGKGRV